MAFVQGIGPRLQLSHLQVDSMVSSAQRSLGLIRRRWTLTITGFGNRILIVQARGKARFHQAAKKALQALADTLGLKKREYDLRSNMAGIAVSGEVTLHANHWYVQVGQNAYVGDVMYRLVNDQQDYTGQRNHFASAKDLEDVATFARRFRIMLSSPLAKGGPCAKPFQISDEAMRRFAFTE